MNCTQCQALLVDHAHRELDAERHLEVARHLTQCPTCAVEFCRLQADLEGITAAHCEMPPAHLEAALRRQVADEFAPPWWHRLTAALHRPVPMYGAVLAAVLPLVVWIVAAGHRPAGSDSGAARPHSTSAAPARVTDYDATAVLPAHRDVL